MTVVEANEGKNIETVTMSDGRKVDFAGKRKLIKESVFDEGGHPSIRLDFRNGETRTFHLPKGLLMKFAAHGAEQKYGDETAGVTDIDDMVLAVDELHERLSKGEWATRREGSGMAGTSVLLRALVELSGKDPASIKQFLSGKTQAEKMALRNSAKVKPIVERLEAEKIAKSSHVDTESLLAELE